MKNDVITSAVMTLDIMTYDSAIRTGMYVNIHCAQ